MRWVDEIADAYRPLERSLQVLFMATSPDGVKPVLEFEREEARLLDIAAELPLDLRVEESGCVQELEKLWRRFPAGSFDVFHLTGHASIQAREPYHPYFTTESLTGTAVETTAVELVQSFQGRLPRLVFLSGCRTGEAGKEGGVSSMAETLVRRGVAAVLGWGRPVLDTNATDAAAYLYQQLAAGFSVAEALGYTYRKLREGKARDWHLLRLYARGRAWQSLVNPPRDYVPALDSMREQWFLDPENRVAGGVSQTVCGTAQDFAGGLAATVVQSASGGVAARLGWSGQEYDRGSPVGTLASHLSAVGGLSRFGWGDAGALARQAMFVRAGARDFGEQAAVSAKADSFFQGRAE